MLANRASLDLAFVSLSRLGSRDYQYFVAQYTPCTLAIYASPRPLPDQDARLATGRLAETYPGRTFTCKTPPASPGALNDFETPAIAIY